MLCSKGFDHLNMVIFSQGLALGGLRPHKPPQGLVPVAR